MQQTIPVNDGYRAAHVTSNLTGPFPVDFPFFSYDDVIVTIQADGSDEIVTQVRGVDYELTGVATEDGSFSSGTIYTTLPLLNVTLVRQRVTAIERLSNFPLQGFFSRLALNAELNRITVVLQDLETRISRLEEGD